MTDSTEILSCSVVICTFNRASHLERLLASLNHLSYRNFEVVVVNCESTDGTTKLLERYKSRLKLVKCPAGNIANSRNRGIEAASGDIIIFIDDDAFPTSTNWLDLMVDVFKGDAHKLIGAAGGGALIRDTRHYQFHGGRTSDYAEQVFRDEDRIAAYADESRWITGTVGCNSAFRREALLNVGGFDERFSYYLDETDLCLRISRSGYRIVFVEGCDVRHYTAVAPEASPINLRNWRLITRSDTYYCLKNGSDPFLVRLAKTLWLAPRKHFVKEVFDLLKGRSIGWRELFHFVSLWAAGLFHGLLMGVFARRELNFRAYSQNQFLPFPSGEPFEKLRICLLSQLFPPDNEIGGISRYTHHLALGLHELGHRVHVLTASDKLERYLGTELTVHGLTSVSRAPAEVFPMYPLLDNLVGYSSAIYDKLVDLAHKGIVFDVVESPSWDVEGIATLISDIYPVVVRVHTPLSKVAEVENRTIDYDTHACIALEKWLVENADAVTVSTNALVETVHDSMRIDESSLATVQRISLGLRPSVSLDTAIRNKQGKKNLLFVGRLERRKGAHILLNVLPRLLVDFPDWECYLVGRILDPDGSKWVRRFYREHGGEPWIDRVHFTGAVSDDELIRHYRECDIFVAPSIYESFGIVYMEAMQFGKPVVGFRTGGVPEVVEHELEGLLVRPGSADELYGALAKLMRNDRLREELGARAHEKMQHQFDHLTMARRMSKLYSETVGSQHGYNRLNGLVVPVTDIEETELEGDWRVLEGDSGSSYLVSKRVGDALSFSAKKMKALVIATLRHQWSGSLKIQIGKNHRDYIDLYSQNSVPKYGHLIETSSSSHTDEVKVRFENFGQTHPLSKGNEVWIRTLQLVT